MNTIIKQLITRIDFSDPIAVCTDLENYIMNALRERYLNTCHFDMFVTNIDKLLRYDTIEISHLTSEGSINVECVLSGIQIQVNSCIFVKTTKKASDWYFGVLESKPETTIAMVAIEYIEGFNILDDNMLLPVVVHGVQYPISKQYMQIHAKPYIGESNSIYFVYKIDGIRKDALKDINTDLITKLKENTSKNLKYFIKLTSDTRKIEHDKKYNINEFVELVKSDKYEYTGHILVTSTLVYEIPDASQYNIIYDNADESHIMKTIMLLHDTYVKLIIDFTEKHDNTIFNKHKILYAAIQKANITTS